MLSMMMYSIYVNTSSTIRISPKYALRTPVYKYDDQYQPENYRGVTVLPILEKVFEIAVCNRLIFVNEAFENVDETNGAYLKGRETSDNLFVLNGLIERQLSLKKSLYICYGDFSKLLT